MAETLAAAAPRRRRSLPTNLWIGGCILTALVLLAMVWRLFTIGYRLKT